MNQFNTIKIYTIFEQQHDTNSSQVPIDYKLGETRTKKVQKFHGLQVLKPYGVCSLIIVGLCYKSISKDI